MEDGLILADDALRAELKKLYPKVASRIEKRKSFMQDVIGMDISDDVLPLSQISGMYFPFMLDTTRLFSVK